MSTTDVTTTEGSPLVPVCKQPDQQEFLSYDLPAAVTPLEYSGLQEAFDHFNRELFGGGLPDCFIAYARKPRMLGHYHPERYSGRVGKLDRGEVALNPDHFLGRSDEEICSTIVHEQCHVWQKHYGKPAAKGYHNKEWASAMKAVGLQPSNTGGVGGKETGSQMSHYILPDGLFAQSFARLAAKGWHLHLQSAPQPGPTAGVRKSKTKFSCLGCGQNCWGKPDLLVSCHPCGLIMVPEDAVL